MRISDWSSDVCSSDLGRPMRNGAAGPGTSESLAHIHIPVARDRRMERAHISEGTRIDRRLRIEIGRASCREECVSTCRSRWSPYHEKKKIYKYIYNNNKYINKEYITIINK